ncbi:MAG: DODA-type extradiol aromatic ring-opening family dioxygenase, partial [bacterium]
YDYYGFPEQSYHLDYPVPGAPALAEVVQGQLRKQGIAAELEQSRGLDHGVFVPLMLMYPNADIPCIQVSLQQRLDPLAHLQLGQALASLDQEGLLILGSGFSFHNMQAFFRQGAGIPDAKNLAFETWLKETLNNRDFTETERWEHLRNWERAPNARYCHPREEHLLPLLVCYGAAQRPCARVESVTVLGKQASSFIW